MAVDLKLFDAFNRSAAYKSEVIDLGNISVYWTGNGIVYFNINQVDDRIRVTGPNGVFLKKYADPPVVDVLGPFDITSIFEKGLNTLNVKVEDIYGGTIGLYYDVALNGEVSFSSFTAKHGRSSRRSIGATIPGGIGCGLGKRRR